MDTASIRNMILSTPLREQPVTIAEWAGANLIIRELSGSAGAALMSACSDASGNVNQDALVAGVVLATLRNGDDANKALVFSSDPVNSPNVYDAAFRDGLMSTGLGSIMAVAQASIKLSGLNNSATVADAKNVSSATVPAASPSPLPAN